MFENWKDRIKDFLDDVADFFAATVKYPGCGVYCGFNAYGGFKPHFDRYGIIINVGYFRLIVCTYDFIASSQQVMEEVLKHRTENQKMKLAFSGRTPRRR
jgi:hypothetical protein